MATRAQNEKEYRNWENLPGGGRRYWRDRMGRTSGFQRFLKIVDADENTLQVVQEVYNDDGELVEQHQKFPIDTGHQILKRSDDREGQEGNES